MRNAGSGSHTFGSVRVEASTGGLLYAGPTFSANWPDGRPSQHMLVVVTAPASGSIRGYTDYISSSNYQDALYMVAVQID